MNVYKIRTHKNNTTCTAHIIIIYNENNNEKNNIATKEKKYIERCTHLMFIIRAILPKHSKSVPYSSLNNIKYNAHKNICNVNISY